MNGVTRAIGPLGVLTLALTGGCGDSEPMPNGADAAPNVTADAMAMQGCEPPTATFGRCVVEGMTDPCTGAAGEVSTFAPIADNEALDIVLGPQGSEMFVLALRTSGIYPGDGSADNPRVSVVVWLGDEQVSTYMSKPTFMDDAGADTVTAQDLYLVIYRPSAELAGKALEAEASIRDRDDVSRCARAAFMAR